MALAHRFIWGVNSRVGGGAGWTDDETVVYTAGHAAVLYAAGGDRSQKFLAGSSESEGFSALALSPSRRFLAIAEAADRAAVVVYDLRTLRKRKQLGQPDASVGRYASISFGRDDETLLALAADAAPPQLVSWRWAKGKVGATASLQTPHPDDKFLSIGHSPLDGVVSALSTGGLWFARAHEEELRVLPPCRERLGDDEKLSCHCWSAAPARKRTRPPFFSTSSLAPVLSRRHAGRRRGERRGHRRDSAAAPSRDAPPRGARLRFAAQARGRGAPVRGRRHDGRIAPLRRLRLRVPSRVFVGRRRRRRLEPRAARAGLRVRVDQRQDPRLRGSLGLDERDARGPIYTVARGSARPRADFRRLAAALGGRTRRGLGRPAALGARVRRDPGHGAEAAAGRRATARRGIPRAGRDYRPRRVRPETVDCVLRPRSLRPGVELPRPFARTRQIFRRGPVRAAEQSILPVGRGVAFGLQEAGTSNATLQTALVRPRSHVGAAGTRSRSTRRASTRPSASRTNYGW